MRIPLWTTLVATWTLAACGGPTPGPDAETPADTARDTAPATPDAGPDATAAPDAADAPAPDASRPDATGPDATGPDAVGPDAGGARIVRAFAPAMSEFPESVALHMGAAYVSLAFDGRVVRVAPDGTATDFGRVPIPVPMSAFALGIAVDAAGNAYVALAKADPAGPAVPGVYRIPAAGGAGTLFASHPMMNVPNDLEFDEAGNLFITDGPTGAIYRAGRAGGTATLWSQDPLLAPAPSATGPCGMRASPFPIGANGIVVEPRQVIVNNTERASIVRIALNADGSAGAAASVVTSCPMLAGTDGLARDTDGSWLTTVQATNALARVRPDGTITVLHSGAPFFSPAAVDVGRFGSGHAAVIANSAFGDLFAMRTPTPNLAVLGL